MELTVRRSDYAVSHRKTHSCFSIFLFFSPLALARAFSTGVAIAIEFVYHTC
ncbi:hypothetical protein BDV28DRAFT_138587 [Aspergillus coremiiformis]|uniref:Uncharacterized protein n=1 Tax=Aspergillus coremiiformis TaxID=138285 RepID=A0A5N6Z206_9EURO|nr:hypothetical protein BDV28DRAFT_138587 [Aspergillus coremiiformis]